MPTLSEQITDLKKTATSSHRTLLDLAQSKVSNSKVINPISYATDLAIMEDIDNLKLSIFNHSTDTTTITSKHLDIPNITNGNISTTSFNDGSIIINSSKFPEDSGTHKLSFFVHSESPGSLDNVIIGKNAPADVHAKTLNYINEDNIVVDVGSKLTSLDTAVLNLNELQELTYSLTTTEVTKNTTRIAQLGNNINNHTDKIDGLTTDLATAQGLGPKDSAKSIIEFKPGNLATSSYNGNIVNFEANQLYVTKAWTIGGYTYTAATNEILMVLYYDRVSENWADYISTALIDDNILISGLPPPYINGVYVLKGSPGVNGHPTDSAKDIVTFTLTINTQWDDPSDVKSGHVVHVNSTTDTGTVISQHLVTGINPTIFSLINKYDDQQLKSQIQLQFDKINLFFSQYVEVDAEGTASAIGTLNLD
jgi:hypothetical protein